MVEGSSVALVVILDEAPGRNLELALEVLSASTANPADDFTLPDPFTVVFGPADTSATVTLGAVDDADADDGETLIVAFASTLPEGVSAGSPSQATVTVVPEANVNLPTVAPSAGDGVPLFVDLDEAGVHRAAVEALAALGVFGGTECESQRFCPRQQLRRWEMAVWMVRVLDGEDPPAGGPVRFGDVGDGEWWAPHVERLADLGIVGGCVGDAAAFCPQGLMTRAEMARFLVLAFGIDPAVEFGFVDIEGSDFAAEINALAAVGATKGCSSNGAPKFCPDRIMNRGEMASFLNRLFLLIEKEHHNE